MDKENNKREMQTGTSKKKKANDEAVQCAPPTKKARRRILHSKLPVCDNDDIYVSSANVSQDLLLSKLQKYGVVVVKDVFDDTLASEYTSNLKIALSECNSQWSHHPPPGCTGHGLLKFYGVANHRLVQDFRVSPEFVRLFEMLYGEDKLAVSLDAIAVVSKHWKLSAKAKSAKNKSSLESHLDVASLESASIGSQITSKLQTSKYKCKFCVQASAVFQDSLPFSQDNGRLYAPPGFLACTSGPVDPGTPVEFIPASKGSVIMWTSATVHSNYGGDREECIRYLKDDQPLLRSALMFSFLPKPIDTWSKSPSDRTKVKEKAIKNGKTTSHWALAPKNKILVCGPGHMSNPKEGKRRWEPLCNTEISPRLAEYF
eukprot:m.5298 g.5298  ORF g.5298 m.5298 type:complete len:373 (+) comp3267_c0_seq1:306-1424(+)